jgi:aspartyl-tRNA(Asn)/glutamyl-tRNA(Gln) amidotransferase subunit C
MAQVDEAVVAHVARLARLTLTDDERRLFARQLADVLRHAESLQALDLEGVTPFGGGATAPAFREDQERPGLPAEKSVEPAPDAADRLFRVPRVLPG